MVDALRKIRSSINRIIIGKEKNGFCLQKDALFNIINLANQLHRLKSTYPDSPKYGKIYFSEIQAPNLIKLKLNHLLQAVKVYEKAIWKNMLYKHKGFIFENRTRNEVVDELFRKARKDAAITSDFSNIFK